MGRNRSKNKAALLDERKMRKHFAPWKHERSTTPPTMLAASTSLDAQVGTVSIDNRQQFPIILQGIACLGCEEQQQEQQQHRLSSMDDCSPEEIAPPDTCTLISNNLANHLKLFQLKWQQSESEYGVDLDPVELRTLKTELHQTLKLVQTSTKNTLAPPLAAASQSVSARSIDDDENDVASASASLLALSGCCNYKVEYPATDSKEPKKPAAKRRKMNGTQPGCISEAVVVELTSNFSSNTSTTALLKPLETDVYFGWINHPGTRKWREVVKRFSDDRSHYSTWTDRIGKEVVATCTTEYGINRFFVSSRIEQSKKVSMDCSNETWKPASQEMIATKTRDRFLNDRKTRKSRRT